jgi:O-antigen/teichoic acid export membrane protein
MLLATLYNALLTEPMMVFSVTKYRESPSEYWSTLLVSHRRLAAAGSLALSSIVFGTFIYGSHELAISLLGLVIAGPLLLFQLLTRRIPYVKADPRSSALAAAIYASLLVLLILLLHALYKVTLPLIWLIMGFAAFISSSWVVSRMQLRAGKPASPTLVSQVTADHWNYGRWGMISSPMIWASANIYFIYLSFGTGLEDSGALRALLNVAMPLIQLNACLGNVLVPAMVNSRNSPGLDRLIVKLTLYTVLLPIVAWPILGVFSGELLRLIYADKYTSYASLLWVIGIIPIFNAAIVVLSAAFRAQERPKAIFTAYVFSTIITLSAGVVLTVTWGVSGAVIGMSLSYATLTAALAYLYWRRAPAKSLTAVKELTICLSQVETAPGMRP